MKANKKIERNPFPQLGNPNSPSVTINPVGYEYELKRRVEMIERNINNQPLLIPIIGQWGQGKSTILKYFEKKVLDDCYKKNIVLDDVEDFKSKIQDAYIKYLDLKDRYKGLIILLDEGQNLVQTIRKFDKKQKETGEIDQQFTIFLKDLRNFFIDNKSEKVDSREICLLFGMHPEIYENIKKYAPDILQRIHTNLLELSDMNFYQAYEVVNQILKKNELDLRNIFDNSVIYSIYALLPYINKKFEGVERYNGRIFSQIFFKLYNFWLRKKDKISLETLKKILIGGNKIKIEKIPLKIPNPQEYINLKNNSIYNEESLDFYLFNPIWHFEENLSPRLINFYQKNKATLFNEREGYLFDYEKFKETLDTLDEELENELNKLNSEHIYKNDKHKILIFTEKFLVKDKLFNEFLKKYEEKKRNVFRINDIYLKKIFGYIPGQESPYTNILREYFQKTPFGKLEQIRNIVRDLNIISNFKLSDLDTQEDKIPYMEFSYEFFKKKKNHIAFFYYPTGWDLKLKEFIRILKDKLENQEKIDFIIIVYGPYVDRENIKEIDEIENLSQFRFLNNRIFLSSFNRNTLGEFIKNKDSKILNRMINDCKGSYFRESLEKGYLIPLTGIKLDGSNNLPHEKFMEDIVTSIELDVKKKFQPVLLNRDEFVFNNIQGYSKNGKIKSTYMKSFPQKFIVDTLSQFFKFNLTEANISKIGDIKIEGSKISKYEKNILDLIKNKTETKRKQFEKLIRKYYNINSRISPIEFLPKILKIRNLIHISNKNLKILRTSNIVGDIQSFIKKHENAVLFFDIEEKKIFSNLKSRFKEFREMYSNEYDIDNYNIKSINNTYLLNLYDKLNDLFKGSVNPIDIINEILKIKGSIKELLNSEIIENPEVLKLKDLHLVNHIKKKNKNIEKFYENLEKKPSLNKYFKNIENEYSDQFLSFFLIYLAKSTEMNINKTKSTAQIKKVTSKIFEEFVNFIYKKDSINKEQELEIGDYFELNPRTLIEIKEILIQMEQDFNQILNDIRKLKIPNSTTRRIGIIYIDGYEKLDEYNQYSLLFQYITEILDIDFFKKLFKDDKLYTCLNFSLDDKEKYDFYNLFNLEEYQLNFLRLVKYGSIQKIHNFLIDFYDKTNDISEDYIDGIIKNLVREKLNRFLENDYPFKPAKKIKIGSLGNHFFKDLKIFVFNLFLLKHRSEAKYNFFVLIFFKYLLNNKLDFRTEDENSINMFFGEYERNVTFSELFRKGYFKKIKSTVEYYNGDKNNKEKKIEDQNYIEPRFEKIVYTPKKLKINDIIEKFHVQSFKKFKELKIQEINQEPEKENIAQKLTDLLENEEENFKKLLKEYLYSNIHNFNEVLAKKVNLNEKELKVYIHFLQKNIELLDNELNKLYYLKDKILDFKK